ncbi:hypothetical protein ACFY83_04280 [Streptomyces althioticus]|nr:hypothetical protein OG968_04680 [Streptomyces althioticus]WTC00306.1 hypothetical protein OHA53_31075 [Streptomyces althioticus]
MGRHGLDGAHPEDGHDRFVVAGAADAAGRGCWGGADGNGSWTAP